MSSTTNSSNLSQRTLDFRIKYKTERCRYWYQRGFCPFNQACAFAHSEHELRDKHSLNQNYKTKICLNFKTLGYCKYGARCQFLHLNEDQPACAQPYTSNSIISYQIEDQNGQKSNDSSDEKHQKKLAELGQFGLALLGMFAFFYCRKGEPKFMRWRWYIENEKHGEWRTESLASDGLTQMDFEAAFPDYDFSRKPRLGSM